MNSKDKRFNNKVKKYNLLNYFLLPNNNISSILSEKNKKIETDFRKTTQYSNNINFIKQKSNFTNKEVEQKSSQKKTSLIPFVIHSATSIEFLSSSRIS